MRTFLLLIAGLTLHSVSFAQLSVQGLLTENRNNPIGMDTRQPRFSWQLVSNERNCMQTAFEVKVEDGKTAAWSSGKQLSGQSVLVAYKGQPLESGKKYSWRVKVWDNKGRASAWSAPAFFQMAFLNKSDWKARWMEAGYNEDTVNRPAQYFRKQFTASKKIARATAYITAHGMYEAHINGRRVGNDYLTPGWTSYNKRLQYQVYDITSLLNLGANAIGVTVGNGWYRGYLAWNDNKNIYGKKMALLLQIDIVYTDGSTDIVVTDESWKCSEGPIRSVEIYHGEVYDAGFEQPGWNAAGFNDATWKKVITQNYEYNNLVATYNEPVRKQETFRPVKIFTTPKGEKVIDFGQNLVGWVKLNARGKAGDEIKIQHAEVLDKEGNFYTENLRAAKTTATYILKGSGIEILEPHFTFYGFRYIKIEGWKEEIKPEDFLAIALYSDITLTGSFSSSHPLINQLQHNIQWGQRGNFLDIPTDCPQRDERLGWTGDAQAFSRTAAFNFGVNNFFAKWLKDVEADQLPNGSVPFVIPNVLGPGASGATGWADAATIIPWNIYLAYGDSKVLENQYESMKKWVGFMQNASKNNLWNTGFHFGDWLFYRPFDDNDGQSAVTDKYLIAQCFYANSVQLMIYTASVLGKPEDEEQYKMLLKNIKEAFVKEYLTPNGRLVSGTQTAYVLALQFDMLPESVREQAAARLVENIKNYGNHLTTGFLGTPYLCHVLTRFGYTDMAFTLLTQESYPSWLYPVKMGATTIWERWNGIHPDGTFEPASMNSFNHYAYGAIGDWMYRTVTGLDTYEDGPGYKHIKIQPHTGGGLTNAKSSLKTYYGSVVSGWELEKNKLVITIEVPANTYATVHIPANYAKVTENGIALEMVKGIKLLPKQQDAILFEVGSGKYRFVAEGAGQ
jgi:alpha-L-rhamnosidase